MLVSERFSGRSRSYMWQYHVDQGFRGVYTYGHPMRGKIRTFTLLVRSCFLSSTVLGTFFAKA